MLRRSLCYVFILATLAVLPPSILPSNASYQSDHRQWLVDEARETHHRARKKALDEYLREIQQNHDEAKQELRKADFAYHHRLRAASDSFHRSRANGENEDEIFQTYINLTEASEIERALQTFKINAQFDHNSLQSNQLLDEKLSEANRRLTDVFRKVEE